MPSSVTSVYRPLLLHTLHTSRIPRIPRISRIFRPAPHTLSYDLAVTLPGRGVCHRCVTAADLGPFFASACGYHATTTASTIATITTAAAATAIVSGFRRCTRITPHPSYLPLTLIKVF